jgi:predicted aspartyl protease
MIAVVGLLAIPTLSWPASGQESLPAIRAGEHRLSFQLRDGLIYIHAPVNDRHVTLLIDTGAAFTTFTIKLVPTLNTESRVTLNLAIGIISAFRLPIGVVLGDSDLKERRRFFRLNAVVGDFKFLNADGLVGQDVLSQFKSITFDFKNATLILEDH